MVDPKGKKQTRSLNTSQYANRIYEEAKEVANEELIRHQSKNRSNELNIFKKKLKLQSKLQDPTATLPYAPSRQFDKDFTSKFLDSAPAQRK